MFSGGGGKRLAKPRSVSIEVVIMNVQQLRAKTKEFIANKYNDESLPERVSKDIDFFGPTMITEKHVVSLQNDRSSSYQAYIDVQNELVAAYNELRDELSQEKWGKNYSELNEDQQKAVREIYPQKISEAEPKKYGEKKYSTQAFHVYPFY